MPYTSPYEVLGLPENAHPESVRREHRRLVRRHHPDRNPDDPGATEAFLAVQEAYEAITTGGGAEPDLEDVVAWAEEAAAEAQRLRGDVGRGEAWPVVAVELRRTAARRTADALGRPVGRVGVAAAVALAVASVVVLPVPVCLAIAAAGFAVAVRAADGPGATVEAHWDGLRDLRWGTRIAWEDVADVAEHDGALGLTLAPAVSDRLRAVLPARAFDGDVYRLPLADPSELGALVRARVAA